MSTEKPTIPESIFTLSMNLVRIDALQRIAMTLQPCDVLKQDVIDDLSLQLKVIRKELDDSFEVEAEDLKEEPKNIHVNEDEESDVNVENKGEYDFKNA